MVLLVGSQCAVGRSDSDTLAQAPARISLLLGAVRRGPGVRVSVARLREQPLRICDTGSMDVVVGDDGVARCAWGGSTPDYATYHDTEWGFGVTDDTRLFEKLCLEGFQSGLSWLTILRKRDSFRAAFAGFDLEMVAGFGERDVQRLLGDAGIVRHQGKIRSTINNAARAIEMIEHHGSIAAYFWPHATFPIRPRSTCRRSPPPRRCCRNSSSVTAGRSSVPPRCTPSCRRWASSTTTSPAAVCANGRSVRGGRGPISGNLVTSVSGQSYRSTSWIAYSFTGGTNTVSGGPGKAF